MGTVPVNTGPEVVSAAGMVFMESCVELFLFVL
jgi:hypothetical protein